MATSKKVTELTELTVAVANDIMYIVDDPSGSPISKKISVQNVLESNVAANVNADGYITVTQGITGNTVTAVLANTPADSNSAPSGLANGTMWSDGTYLYVVTDSTATEVKRLTLNTF